MLRRLISTTLSLVISIAVALSAVIPASALTIYTVLGHVTDASTGMPLQGVCIIIGPPAGCPPTAPITNANGDWTTQLISGSDWDVWYSKTGYALVKDVIPASQSGTATLNKALTPTGAPTGSCPAANTGTPTQTVYLPNITKTLGGATGFQTPFIVQNTGVATTNLEVSFYKFSDGSCVARRTVSNLAAGTSFADVPNNDTDLPGDSQFSVVVKSFGSSIVSVVNEHAGFGARAEALSYDGFSSGSTTVSLPNIVRRFFGYHTPFIMQNLGTAPTTATASFQKFGSTATPITIQRTIAPGQSQFIEPNVEVTLQDNTQYAVTVTASQPLAIVVNTHNDDANVAAPVAYATDGVAQGAQNVYGPYAAKNANDAGIANTVSTIVVQNVGTLSVTPTLTFTPLNGGAARTFTSPTALAAGASWAFDPRYADGVAGGTFCGTTATTTCLADGEYSFVASAPGTIAAAVNVVSPTTAMGYIAATRAATSFFLPNVTRTLGGANGWTTPILLQTVTATGATVAWRRFSDGQLVTTQNVTVTAGSGIRIDPRTVAQLTDNTQYAVTITGTGGTVAAIVTELNFEGGDGAMIYEGYPAP